MLYRCGFTIRAISGSNRTQLHTEGSHVSNSSSGEMQICWKSTMTVRHLRCMTNIETAHFTQHALNPRSLVHLDPSRWGMLWKRALIFHKFLPPLKSRAIKTAACSVPVAPVAPVGRSPGGTHAKWLDEFICQGGFAKLRRLSPTPLPSLFIWEDMHDRGSLQLKNRHVGYCCALGDVLKFHSESLLGDNMGTNI